MAGFAELPGGGGGSPAGTVELYRTHLSVLRDVLAGCRADATACHAVAIGGDDRVAAEEGRAAFEVHWGWLRDVVEKARDANAADREKMLGVAGSRLDDQMREAGVDSGVTQTGGEPFPVARATADRVLARAEFRQVTGESFWQMVTARFFKWLGRVFGGAAELGHRAPWLGPAIEYGSLTLALAALLVWMRRAVNRQRLAVRVEAGAATVAWQEASRNWARLAEGAAAEGAWREAVHSLYWASVTELEGRRVWRQNSARTPREYLRLLAPEAPQYGPLRVLTQMLERIWYGLEAADREDYDRALRVYEDLRSA